jgi:hypothetical protein
MKNNITSEPTKQNLRRKRNISIKNELPDILETLCYHPECPDWLRHGIWELFNECGGNVVYTANYWLAQLDALDSVNVRRLEAKLNHEELPEDPPLLEGIQ